MSVRSVSLMPRPNSALSSRAGSGLTAKAPKFGASCAGPVRLNLSLAPIGTMTSLISGLPRRETWTHEALTCFLPLWRRTFRRLRSVVAQTPTTALAESAAATARPSRVTSASGTCRTNEWVL